MDENTGFYFWKRIDEIKGSVSIKDISELSGIPYGTLKNQRSRNIVPKMEDVFAISKVLDVSMDTLMPKEDVAFQTERALEKKGGTRRIKRQTGMKDKEKIRAFWNRLKDVLSEKGISQRSLFLSLGLDTASAYQWSIHLVLPPADAVVMLADFLDVDVHWLLWGDEISNAETMKKKLETMHAEVSLKTATEKLRKQEETIRRIQEKLDRLKEEG